MFLRLMITHEVGEEKEEEDNEKEKDDEKE